MDTETDTEPRPQWRHLLAITGVDEDRVVPSRPLRVIVSVGKRPAEQPGAQHLVWLVVTLLTRSTSSVVETIGLEFEDVALLPGIDPGLPEGGRSLLAALKETAVKFGPSAAPVVDSTALDEADLVLQIGTPGTTPWPDSQALQVGASGWTGAVAPLGTVVPLDLDGTNPFGPFIAACLAAGQAFMHARVRDHRLQSIALNGWTLLQETVELVPVAAVDPGSPAAVLDHVLAGTGAVGSALLLALWACQQVSGTIRAADADEKGVDDTNLNRCVPFWWEDLGQPKADTAAERMSGYHGLVIEPTNGNAENLVNGETHLISAVDIPEARQALQDQYPASAVQASTSGLRLEMLRTDPTVSTACLRCFNPTRTKTSDAEVRAQVAYMDEATAAVHAAAVGTDVEQVREWGRAGGCGRVGDALLDRLRASDESAAQFSVGFASVLAGVLLAAQVIKDTIRRAGDPDGVVGNTSLSGEQARFVTNLLDPANVLAGVRRYGRDRSCPSCDGIRAAVWRGRWTG